MANESIGLAEFIEQVKQDLLSVAPGKEKEAPFLFVESVELELQVTVKKTGKTGAKGSIKIEVLGSGGEIGVDAGGEVGRDDVQKVKIKLSPLFDKEYLIKTYKDLYPEQVMPALNKSMEAFVKGDEESDLNDDLGDQ